MTSRRSGAVLSAIPSAIALATAEASATAEVLPATSHVTSHSIETLAPFALVLPLIPPSRTAVKIKMTSTTSFALKLGQFPSPSSLPCATLPSMSLLPVAPFILHGQNVGVMAAMFCARSRATLSIVSSDPIRYFNRNSQFRNAPINGSAIPTPVSGTPGDYPGVFPGTSALTRSRR